MFVINTPKPQWPKTKTDAVYEEVHAGYSPMSDIICGACPIQNRFFFFRMLILSLVSFSYCLICWCSLILAQVHVSDISSVWLMLPWMHHRAQSHIQILIEVWNTLHLYITLSQSCFISIHLPSCFMSIFNLCLKGWSCCTNNSKTWQCATETYLMNQSWSMWLKHQVWWGDCDLPRRDTWNKHKGHVSSCFQRGFIAWGLTGVFDDVTLFLCIYATFGWKLVVIEIHNSHSSAKQGMLHLVAQVHMSLDYWLTGSVPLTKLFTFNVQCRKLRSWCYPESLGQNPVSPENSVGLFAYWRQKKERCLT